MPRTEPAHPYSVPVAGRAVFEGVSTEMVLSQNARVVGTVLGRGSVLRSNDGDVFLARRGRLGFSLTYSNYAFAGLLTYRYRLGRRLVIVDGGQIFHLTQQLADVGGWLRGDRPTWLRLNGRDAAMFALANEAGLITVRVDIFEDAAAAPRSASLLLLSSWLVIRQALSEAPTAGP